MKKFTFLLLTFLSTGVFAQIKFEKGKITKSNGEEVEVLIKNQDWRSNPTQIEIKKDENSSSETLKLADISAFEINNEARYVKKKVNLDDSERDYGKLTYSSSPIYKEKELILKTIIAGQQNLYKYSIGDQDYYFFTNNEGDIEQLVYKPFLVDSNKVAYNKSFRSQILKNFKCSEVSKESLLKVDYNENDLKNLFININKCNNSEIKFVEKDQNKKIDFKLSVRPRLNMNTLKLNTNSLEFGNIEFDTKSSFGLGLEAEFVLPFHKNKWAVIVEPNYVSYKATHQKYRSIAEITTTHTLDYSSIDVPIGVRHYMFINDNSKVFINAQYIQIFSLDSKIEVNRNGQNVGTLEIGNGSNFSFGAGYKFKDRYSIEARYTSDLKNKGTYENNYNMISFILGYKIL